VSIVSTAMRRAAPQAALALATLLASLGTSIVNVALPTLADTFGAPFATVQWIVLAYLLTTTSLVVAVGSLGDLFGRRRTLLAGIAIFTAATALCSVAPRIRVLIAARALQGGRRSVHLPRRPACLPGHPGVR
jgi:MFS family permease